MGTVPNEFRKIMEVYAAVPPSLLYSGRLRWQMTEKVAIALLTEACYPVSQAMAVVRTVALESQIECLGIAVELIEKDEINLIIRVV